MLAKSWEMLFPVLQRATLVVKNGLIILVLNSFCLP